MTFMFKATHYSQLMYLRTSKAICLEAYELDSPKCFLAPGLSWQVAFKKAG